MLQREEVPHPENLAEFHTPVEIYILCKKHVYSCPPCTSMPMERRGDLVIVEQENFLNNFWKLTVTAVKKLKTDEWLSLYRSLSATYRYK